MFPPGLEPGTFRVLGERDNHYTTETCFTVQIHTYKNQNHKKFHRLPLNFTQMKTRYKVIFG